MTEERWPEKRCTGAHCYLRDTCKHHALPTMDTKGLIWPADVGDLCKWYEYKPHYHAGDEEDND